MDLGAYEQTIVPLWYFLCYIEAKRGLMEKPKPHYSLEEIQSLLENEATRFVTRSSQMTAADLGLSIEDMIEVLQRLRRKHFYKSMTSDKNPRIWQDVYHIEADCLRGTVIIYTKLQINDKAGVVISFKEK